MYQAVLNLIAERRYPLLLISHVHLNRYRQVGYVQQQASACAACSTVFPLDTPPGFAGLAWTVPGRLPAC